MTEPATTPKDAVVSLMKAAVPERAGEIAELWNAYPCDVVLATDAKRITLNADRDRIEFDAKTMQVFWLIGFGGWKAIECYAPHVVTSAATGQKVGGLLQVDPELDDVERAYKERRAVAQALIDEKDVSLVPWPPDLPRPSADRDASTSPEYKSAFDLTVLAAAFAFFHEFRHVMLDRNKMRPDDRREEELQCDVWARAFMTEKLVEYAQANDHAYDDVLRKRSMGIALAALVLHEITPVWEHGGNCDYFSVPSRLTTLLANTALPPNDHFWVFVAALLIGIYRQKGIPIDAPSLSAHELSTYLLERL